MKQVWILFFLVIVALIGCDKPKSVVVLDGWWNVDFAKIACQRVNEWYREDAATIPEVGCDRLTSCREVMSIVEACFLDPVQEVGVFEDKLATAFESNSDCKSIQFVRFKSPEEGNKMVSDAAGIIVYAA